MKTSIRFKLLVYMTISTVTFAVLLFGLNTFFAEKYYISHKKGALLKDSQKLEMIIKDKNTFADFKDDNLSYDINRLEKSIGATIFIGTTDGYLYYPSLRNREQPQRLGPMSNPFFTIHSEEGSAPQPVQGFRRSPRNAAIKGWEKYDENSFFIITEDPTLKIDTLRYQTQLDNGMILLLWVPMTEISESAAISNSFTAIIGIITMIITGIWAWFISKKFTQPIMQMNKITKNMSELDFSEKLRVQSNDEVGQLSQNINHLSERLDQAIGELNLKNRQLEQDIDHERKLDRMRQEFISNVSHELKTPIFLIQGYAEGLRTNVASNEEKRNFYCDVIMDEADKMNGLVKGLLDLSQIESGSFTIDRCAFNIQNMIEEVLKKFEPILAEKDLHIDLEPGESLMVYADPVRIEQVVVNYLNNAVNHVDDKKIIKVVIKNCDPKVRVIVYNTGAHIPEESLYKIWMSFYKVDKARTREYGGTGLGLSIVRAIQEAHENEYGVNNIHEGVEFWFDMDLADES